MDGLMLVRAARACGLEVGVEGDRVVVTGPKQFAGVARCLIVNKAVIIPSLADAELRRCRTTWSAEVADAFKKEVIAQWAEPGSQRWLDAVCRAVRRNAGVDPSRCRAGEHDVIDMIIIAAQPSVRFDIVVNPDHDIDLDRRAALQSVEAAPVIRRLVTVQGEH